MATGAVELAAPRREELRRNGSPLLHARVYRTTRMHASRADTSVSCSRTWVGPVLGALFGKARKTLGAMAAWQAKMQTGHNARNEKYRIQIRNGYMRLNVDIDTQKLSLVMFFREVTDALQWTKNQSA